MRYRTRLGDIGSAFHHRHRVSFWPVDIAGLRFITELDLCAIEYEQRLASSYRALTDAERAQARRRRELERGPFGASRPVRRSGLGADATRKTVGARGQSGGVA